MTSSPDRAGDAAAREVRNELPPALSSMWRLCKLGYRHEPALMLVAFVLSLLSALPDALMALGGRYRTMFDLQAKRFNATEDEEGKTYDVLA